MPSQQFESHLGHHVHRAQLAYVAVDVEVAVVDLRVGLLVEEVADLYLEVDALHLVLHLGIGKPVVAVLVGEVVVAVLGRGGEGEFLRQVQVQEEKEIHIFSWIFIHELSLILFLLYLSIKYYFLLGKSFIKQ